MSKKECSENDEVMTQLKVFEIGDWWINISEYLSCAGDILSLRECCKEMNIILKKSHHKLYFLNKSDLHFRTVSFKELVFSSYNTLEHAKVKEIVKEHSELTVIIAKCFKIKSDIVDIVSSCKKLGLCDIRFHSGLPLFINHTYDMMNLRVLLLTNSVFEWNSLAVILSSIESSSIEFLGLGGWWMY